MDDVHRLVVLVEEEGAGDVHQEAEGHRGEGHASKSAWVEHDCGDTEVRMNTIYTLLQS